MRVIPLAICLFLFVGCYTPDYTTKHGVDVFCECSHECPDQAYVEHALDFMALRGHDVYDWDNVEEELKYDVIEFHPDPLPCVSEGGCMGTIHYNVLGAVVKLEYHDGWLLSRTALFHEFYKKTIKCLLCEIDYEGEEWLKISDIVREYRAVEQEFLESRIPDICDAAQGS